MMVEVAAGDVAKKVLTEDLGGAGQGKLRCFFLTLGLELERGVASFYVKWIPNLVEEFLCFLLTLYLCL